MELRKMELREMERAMVKRKLSLMNIITQTTYKVDPSNYDENAYHFTQEAWDSLPYVIRQAYTKQRGHFDALKKSFYNCYQTLQAQLPKKCDCHRATGLAPGSEECPKCGAICQNESLYEYHIVQHGIQDVECNVCRQSFTLPSLLEKHAWEKHVIQDSPKSSVYCWECGDESPSACAMNQHRLEMHGMYPLVVPYYCWVCKRGFRNLNNYHVHRYRHTRYKFFGCTDCDQRFIHAATLRKHIRQNNCVPQLPRQ